MKEILPPARFRIFLCVGIFAVSSGLLHADPSIDELIAELRKSADPENGINSEENEVAEKFWKVGAPAIPALLRLLDDPDPNVRQVATYALRNIDGLSEADLDSLIASQRKEDNWLPVAIARIGTPEAVDFLFEEFVKNPESETQITAAISSLGAKAVPRLLELFKEEIKDDVSLEDPVEGILSHMGDGASEMVAPLVKIASDEKVDTPGRVRAIRAIQSIGYPTAAPAVPALVGLAGNAPEDVRFQSALALQTLQSPEAVPYILERYRKARPAEKRWELFGLAELGEIGRPAGPDILPGLASEDPEERLQTITTLGLIGYGAAAPSMRKLLENEDDWRLVFRATESLARLQDKEAIPVLEKVSAEYWYPPVRKIAKEALKSLEDGTHYIPANAGNNFFERAGMFPDLPEDLFTKPISEGKLPIVSIPGKELDVLGGKLIATDNGEWGGGISFVDVDGHSRKIFDGSAQAICRIGKGIFALTGLAHRGTNDGLIVKLRSEKNGNWVTEPWRVLPGQAWSAGLLKNGDLLLNCYRGGLVQVSPEGKMKYLESSEVF